MELRLTPLTIAMACIVLSINALAQNDVYICAGFGVGIKINLFGVAFDTAF